MIEPVKKSSGVTQSERYLSKLCDKTFLSLWSYPNLFKKSGKELCDLLVVFDNHVIIFSDKQVNFNENIEISIAWNRWRNKAVLDSISQLHGAERWVRNFPDQIFLDKNCLQKFPLEIPKAPELQVHLVAVTRGSVKAAKRHFGGGSSGSLMLIPLLPEAEKKPFVLNDSDPKKTFVHVFDEMTLDIVLGELDTTYDLVRYLEAKEKAIRNGSLVMISGEEDLIAYYFLQNGLMDDDPFSITNPELKKEFSGISIAEGFWVDYSASEERERMRQANAPSYFWDALIQNFATHILTGTVAVERDKSVSTHEAVMRRLAREGRLARRALSAAFLEKIQSTPKNRRSSRICFSPFNKDSCFIIVLFPRGKHEDYEEYRKERAALMQIYSLVCKYKFPQAKIITVIGTEPRSSDGRSEDIITVEMDHLDDAEVEFAKKAMKEHNVLNDIGLDRHTDSISPKLIPKKQKLGRNDLCPCGSGLKFKKCHYRA